MQRMARTTHSKLDHGLQCFVAQYVCKAMLQEKQTYYKEVSQCVNFWLLRHPGLWQAMPDHGAATGVAQQPAVTPGRPCSRQSALTDV